MAEPEPKPDHKPELKPESDPQTPWGTLEELLLACAVNRHGVDSWDSIASELNKCRNTTFTSNTCRLKFLDLQRRFSPGDGDGAGGDEVLLWVDELRRLRVAELKRDLHRYDGSIVSLQLKVKRLKEERENSKSEERENSDLKKTDELSPEKTGRIIESSNESISVDRKPEPLPEPVIKPEPDRVSEPIRGGESCNGSTNSKESHPAEADPSERVERVDSGELGESVAESGRGGGEGEEGVKESSDVQSTASLRRREKKMRGISGNSSGDENQSLASKFSIGGGGGGGGVKDNSKRKSKVLLDFLDLVRTRGSVFERRLETQV